MTRWSADDFLSARPHLRKQVDGQLKRRGSPKTARVPQPESELVATLWRDLGLAGLREGWVKEHRFHPDRKWRFDLAHPETMVAVECDGMLPGRGGRHQRMDGFSKDCDKLNQAALLGWLVLRFTRQHIVDQFSAIPLIVDALKRRGS